MGPLKDFFDVRPKEISLVLAMGFLLLSNSLAQQVSGIVAISGFLNQVGVPSILIVWTVDVLLIALTTGLQSLVVDRFDRIKILRILTLSFAIIFVILRVLFLFPVPEWLNFSLLYLVSEQQWLFFPIVFWILANDGLSTSQTKRLFPLFASFGFIGKLIGIGIAAFSPAFLTSLNFSLEEVLVLNVVIYILAFIVSFIGLSRLKLRTSITHKKEKVREMISEGFVFMREVPAFRYLGIAIIAAIVADTIIEFHFLVESDAVFTTQTRYQTFYSFYQLGLTLASVLMGLVAGHIINKMTLKNVFFIWPVTALVGGAWMIALPGIISGVGGVFIQKLPQFTIDESARKSMQSLVPDEIRGRVSIFMDSYLFTAGTLIAALLTGIVILAGASFLIYLAIAIVAALIAIWAIFKMRQVYDNSLLHWRLKRRRSRNTLVGKLVTDLLADDS